MLFRKIARITLLIYIMTMFSSYVYGSETNEKPENLVLGKLLETDSVTGMGGLETNKICDGDFLTRCAISNGSLKSVPYMTFDFGEETEFNTVVLHEYDSLRAKYDIEWSNDKTDWTKVAECIRNEEQYSGDGRGVLGTFAFDTVSARYMRLNFKKDADEGKDTTIWEIQVFNMPGGETENERDNETNLLLNKNAYYTRPRTTSGALLDVSGICDGKKDAATEINKPASWPGESYLVMDLGSITHFNQMVVTETENSDSEYEIWGSDNGTDWNLIASGKTTSPVTDIALGKNSARFIKYKVTACSKAPKISEIELYYNENSEDVETVLSDFSESCAVVELSRGIEKIETENVTVKDADENIIEIKRIENSADLKTVRIYCDFVKGNEYYIEISRPYINYIGDLTFYLPKDDDINVSVTVTEALSNRVSFKAENLSQELKTEDIILKKGDIKQKVNKIINDGEIFTVYFDGECDTAYSLKIKKAGYVFPEQTDFTTENVYIEISEGNYIGQIFSAELKDISGYFTAGETLRFSVYYMENGERVVFDSFLSDRAIKFKFPKELADKETGIKISDLSGDKYIEKDLDENVSSNVNLALGKKVESEGTALSLFEEYKLTDGNYDDTTGRFATSAALPLNVIVDLGKEYVFDKTVLTDFRKNFYTDYQVFASKDKNDWQELYSVTDNDKGTSLTVTNTFEPVSARYVKLYFTKNGGENGGLTFNEFEVYNSETAESYIGNIEPQGEVRAGENISATFTAGEGGNLNYIIYEIDAAAYEEFLQNGSDKDNNAFDSFILDNGEIIYNETAESLDYMIEKRSRGKYLAIGIKNSGEDAERVFLSDAFGPVEQENRKAPVVKNITVSGDLGEGSEIKAVYEYFDINDDSENGSTYKWIGVKGGKEKELAAGTSKAGEKITYTITAADADMDIYIEITPRNDNAPQEGTPKRAKAGNAKGVPVAKNLRISGTAAVGNTLTAVYDYYHPNGTAEKDSVYCWMSGNTVISTSRECYIRSGLAGKTVSFSVTPRCDGEPRQGEKQTVTKHIASSGSAGGSGSSGGGGGGGIYVNKTDLEKFREAEADNSGNTNASDCVFEDMLNHWAKEDVTYMYNMGYIKGTDEKTFTPERTVTRAEIAVIIARMLNLKPQKKYADKFDDVKAEDWYADSIQAVCESGIMSGNGKSFNPNSDITREELAKVAVCGYMAAKNKEMNYSSELDYADKDEISAWAKDYVINARALGIMNGDAENRFMPHSTATRAEAAASLKRMINAK